MAGKSWQLSHKPPHRKGKQTPVTLNKQRERKKERKREEKGGENCLNDKLPLQTILKVRTQSTCKKLSNKEHIEFPCMCIYKNHGLPENAKALCC